MQKEICKNCEQYLAYYHQRVSGYEKLHYGKCKAHKNERKENETCEKFSNNELREKRRKASLFLSLELAAESINQMIQIINEKNDSGDDAIG